MEWRKCTLDWNFLSVEYAVVDLILPGIAHIEITIPKKRR